MLTDAAIKRFKRPTGSPDKKKDGKRLYLFVHPSGLKTWEYRLEIPGKVSDTFFRIGHYLPGDPDHITIEQARIERARLRGLVKRGVDPREQKKAAQQIERAQSAETFKVVAEAYITENLKGNSPWTDSYAKSVRLMLENNIYKEFGGLPIRSINSAMILAALNKVKARGAKVVAIKLRQIISGVFGHAIAELQAESDPTVVLRGKIKHKSKGKRPLQQSEFPEFLKRIRNDCTRGTSIALELLLLTFVRPGELRTVEAAHVDLETATWRIPPENMKMGDPHIVPLSTQAVELFRELLTMPRQGKYLFPNRNPGKCMGVNTLNAALKRMGYNDGFTPHACRATASTLLNECGKWRADVIERQLAHQERDAVRGAYNYAEYLTERKELMQAWADLVYSWGRADGDKVIPIHHKAA